MIWNSNTYEISPLPPKVYGNDFLINNTRPNTPQRKKWIETTRFVFLLPSITKFCCQMNGGDQSMWIKWPKSSMKAFSPDAYGDQKQIWSPHNWPQNVFYCHKISNQKFSIATQLVIDRIINRISITAYGDMMSNSKWLCHINFDNLGCKNMFLLTFY